MSVCPDDLRKTPVTSPSFLDKVAQLTAQGKTVSAQKNVPPKLRYGQLVKLSKEGTVC